MRFTWSSHSQGVSATNISVNNSMASTVSLGLILIRKMNSIILFLRGNHYLN